MESNEMLSDIRDTLESQNRLLERANEHLETLVDALAPRYADENAHEMLQQIRATLYGIREDSSD